MRGVDRELLLGVGIGLILAVSLRIGGGPAGRLNDLAVVERARRLGLAFPGEERPAGEVSAPGLPADLSSGGPPQK